uniref:Retrotransposon gag domain-containing protein n=1 Tax=Ananas comosus var. bracteatus TaxID=296719 RepID=A0A6V7Q3H8_ANACO|nr:unnamed protein product [Ananas comosus var. bracteatus]
MQSEGRLIFPNAKVQKASVFDRLALSNDTTATIPPTRASLRGIAAANSTKESLLGQGYRVQGPQMSQSAFASHNSFAPLELVKKNEMTAIVRPMNRPEVSRRCQDTTEGHQEENISKRIYKAYKTIKGRMGRVRAQKTIVTTSLRKESVPMTKDSHEGMEIHTVRMVGHQDPNQSEEQETLNQMLTRAAARRKAIARQNDPRDIINLYKKMDDVMGLLLNVQSNLENQRNQAAPQSDEVHLTVPQSMNTQQPAQTAPSVALQPARAELQNHQDNFPMTKEEIRELISSQVKQTIDEAAPKRKSRGHPYLIEYDSILFPDGYIVPKFKTFYGLGNPDQHLAHFRASCGNTGGNSALLLRQFPQSLSGVAFKWYYSLEDESMTTWDDIEETFRNKFATVCDKITIADLVATRRRKDESMLEYITRWRNLSIRCEQPIEQTQVVGLLMDWVEKQYKTGMITLSQAVLTNPPTENTNFVNVKEENDEEENTPPPEYWNIFLSKKTHKMLKYLKTIPEVTWRNPLHPEVQTSLSEIAPNHHAEKRKTSLKKKVRKPSQLEKRGEMPPVTIRDFIVKALEDAESKKGPQETENEELFWPETCRVISVRSDGLPDRRRRMTVNVNWHKCKRS